MGRRRKAKPKPDTKAEIKIPEKELWRIDEVAKFFTVTEQTIRMWINDGIIKRFKVSRIVRIPRSEIIRCLRDEDACDSDLFPPGSSID